MGVGSVRGKPDRADTTRRFERLVVVHLPALRRLASRLAGGDREAAQDVVQETLLRAWRRLDQLRNEGSARAWLYAIVRREHARRFERLVPATCDLDPDLTPDPSMSDGGTSPVEGIALERAISGLAPKYRDPFLRYAVGGAAVSDIARALALNPSTVKVRLFRARKKLREALAA